MANPDLNDLHFFACIVEAGSFAAAGRMLGVPKSRLSRRIALLEAQLGVRLLQRTTRQLALTEVGQRVYLHCRAMNNEAEAALDVALQVQSTPRGRVRMSCPIAIAQNLLAPLLPEFMQRYPDVALQLDVSNRRVDLIEEGVDIALRVRSEALEDSSLVVRTFGSASSVLVAAPVLLAARGVPEVPAELEHWPALGMAPHDGRHQWVFEADDGSRISVAYSPRLMTDDLVVLHEAALAGVGVACLPAMICADSLKQGLLVELLPQWRAPTAVFHAVFPSRRGMMPAVRALLDFLAEKLSDEA